MNDQPSRPIIVKDWHVVTLFLGMILTAVISFVTVRDQSDENARRIRELEQRKVDRDILDNYQQAIKERFDHLEKLIDRKIGS